jgi:hypothetical protein
MTSWNSLAGKELGAERWPTIATDDATKSRRRKTARREAVTKREALKASLAFAGTPSPAFGSLLFRTPRLAIMSASGWGVMS